VVAAVIGTVRAHHFLAEKAASVTTNFSIEATNKLDYCIFEYVDYATAAGSTTAYSTTSNVHHWYYGQYTVAALGATSTLLGAAALVSSVLVSMF
jgi:hypothetical protein